jgi:hypothetical protein
MYCIIDIDYLRDFSIPLNDDIIDCFTEKKTSDTIIKEEQIEDVITKEEKITLENLVLDSNTTSYTNKEAKQEKIKKYVTGLKIRYSGKTKSKK